MTIKLAMAISLALVTGPMMIPVSAVAQDLRYDQDRRDGGHYDRRHTYRGRGGDYRHRCGGGNGAVGTIGGGVGGALIGNGLGGGTLGTVAGGVGGALLGRHFDKAHTRSKNGC